jgi:tripartite-type tricarboxylate transporter receptor subunit TctC
MVKAKFSRRLIPWARDAGLAFASFATGSSSMKRLFGFLFSLTFAASAAWADYPDKPISLIVPLPAGGPTDAVARSVADALSKSLGKPIVVENKPGADGAIGAKAAMAAPADGYTLLFGIGSLVAIPYLQNPPPYDAQKDLNPVSAIGRFPFVLSVHPSVRRQRSPSSSPMRRANLADYSMHRARRAKPWPPPSS